MEHTMNHIPIRRRTPSAMISAFKAVIGTATLLVAVAATAIAQTADKPEVQNEPIATQRAVIRFLTTDDFPPFNSRDEDGVLTGLNIDLARAICLDLATQCDIQAKPWNILLKELAAGRGDAVIAAHRVTAKALRQVAFTDRYFHTPARFATRREMRPLIATPRGLDEVQAGVVAGSPHETFLTRHFRNTRLKRFNTPELARVALQNRQVDVIFGDGISLSFWANGSSSGNCCRLIAGPFFEPAYFGDGIAIAVGKKDRDLRAQLNSALSNIRSSGRFRELVERYFPIRVY
jgi:polar amino acid transport system substrate-binding protein